MTAYSYKACFYTVINMLVLSSEYFLRLACSLLICAYFCVCETLWAKWVNTFFSYLRSVRCRPRLYLLFWYECKKKRISGKREGQYAERRAANAIR